MLRARTHTAALVIALVPSALALSACGETASTSGFNGESHNVAQTIADYQSDVTAREQKKLCQNDLAASVIARFAHAGGCQTALKNQLLQIDAPGLTIESIAVKGNAATAHVKSTYSGKSHISTLSLVKEGRRWKIAAASSG